MDHNETWQRLPTGKPCLQLLVHTVPCCKLSTGQPNILKEVMLMSKILNEKIWLGITLQQVYEIYQMSGKGSQGSNPPPTREEGLGRSQGSSPHFSQIQAPSFGLVLLNLEGIANTADNNCVLYSTPSKVK